jgi:hypothetical protein
MEARHGRSVLEEMLSDLLVAGSLEVGACGIAPDATALCA